MRLPPFWPYYSQNCRQVEHTIHLNNIKQHNNRSKEDTIAGKTKIEYIQNGEA